MTDTSTRTAARYVLEINRVLDAPVKNVWRCWTEPKLMEDWFCPKPWRATAFAPSGNCRAWNRQR